MMKRGQAAIEFLTTYGWAMILILVMIGAIVYFGFLKPTNFVSDSCTTGNDLGCSDYVVYNERATLALVNNVGKTINITNVTYINPDTGQTIGSCALGRVVLNGRIADLNCDFDTPFADIDSKQKITVEIIYTNYGSSIPHTIEGSLITDPKPAPVLPPPTTCDVGYCCDRPSKGLCPSGENSLTYCEFTSAPTDDGCINCCTQQCKPCYDETVLRCHDSNADGFADACMIGGNMDETCTDINSCSKVSCTALGGCCGFGTCQNDQPYGLDIYGIIDKGIENCETDGYEKCYSLCGMCNTEKKCEDDFAGTCCQFPDKTTCENNGGGDYAEGSNIITQNCIDALKPFCRIAESQCATC